MAEKYLKIKKTYMTPTVDPTWFSNFHSFLNLQLCISCVQAHQAPDRSQAKLRCFQFGGWFFRVFSKHLSAGSKPARTVSRTSPSVCFVFSSWVESSTRQQTGTLNLRCCIDCENFWPSPFSKPHHYLDPHQIIPSCERPQCRMMQGQKVQKSPSQGSRNLRGFP